MMFLTADEMHELTGYQRCADQRKWLTSRGWVFEISAIGRPMVARSYAENRMGIPTATQKLRVMPNFASLRKAV